MIKILKNNKYFLYNQLKRIKISKFKKGNYENNS